MNLIAASLLAVTTIPFNATTDLSQVAAYRALIDQDLRLATTGYRLAAANVAYCDRKERNPGWAIHDIAQYPDSAAANAAFGFDKPILVAAVIKNGPADRANIRAGDGFVGVDGSTLYWPAMPVGKTGYERMASFKQLLGERLTEKSILPVQLLRDGTEVNTKLAPPLVCASDFQIDTDDGLDAGADGQIVRITYGMMRYASDDAELAAVVAHELSHNLLQHRARLDRVTHGKAKAILATEIEADRLSVWLMANAGYDPKAALRFWERYGRKTGLGIFTDSTHLRWKNRIKVMQVEIDLMATAQSNDGKPPPPLLLKK